MFASFLRPSWALLLPAAAVYALAATNSAQFPATVAALALGAVCLAVPPWLGGAVVLVAANDPFLLREAALGSITPVDVAIAGTFCRAAVGASRRRPALVEWCALGFLLAGAVATAVVQESSAATAFGRVASYLVLGLAIGRAVSAAGRIRLAQAFVGAEAGQAAAALTALTPTWNTSFPIGRYLGTLGDPAQFAIPVAFAASLVALSPYIIRSPVKRHALTLVLCVAVAGSVTRSAWAVVGTAFLVAVVTRAATGRSTATRIALAAGGIAVAILATASVVFAAGVLGLREESARIRGRSLHASWNFLAAHPIRPIGLGTPAAITLHAQPDNPIFASTFDANASGWTPYGARLSHDNREVVRGRASLKIETRGIRKEEGAGLAVGGIRPSSSYTLSLHANLRKGVTMWLYVDEYDENNSWQDYKYRPVLGRGQWTRYSWTWKSAPRTDHAKVYTLIPNRLAESFWLDDVRLDAGGAAMPYEGQGRPPPETISVSATYNTWLAVAIHLGVVAAAFLAALAVGAPYHAYRLGDYATGVALGALLVPSITEDFVYGTSLVTLVWFVALGLVATARSRVAGGVAAKPNRQ